MLLEPVGWRCIDLEAKAQARTRMNIEALPLLGFVYRRYEGDAILTWVMMSSFVVLAMQYFILTVFGLMNTPLQPVIQIISKGIVGAFYAVSLPILWIRWRRSYGLIIIFSALIFAVHYILFPKNREYIEAAVFPLFFASLPSLLLMLSVQDLRVFSQEIERVSHVIFAIGMSLTVLIVTRIVDFGQYSMPIAYQLFIPSIVYADKLFGCNNSKRKLLYLTKLVVSVLTILAIGARGPLIFIAIFIIIRMRVINGLRTSGLRYLVWLLLFVGGMVFSKQILSLLQELLRLSGRVSRSISWLLSANFSLGPREALYTEVANAILSKPLSGIGLAGDWVVVGYYVHNIVLELMAHFGMVLGGTAFLLILSIVIKNLLTDEPSAHSVATVWTCIGLLPLLISFSYLTYIPFWIFLGCMFKVREF